MLLRVRFNGYVAHYVYCLLQYATCLLFNAGKATLIMESVNVLMKFILDAL